MRFFLLGLLVFITACSPQTQALPTLVMFPTITVTPSPSPTLTIAPTMTASPTLTQTPTITPTATITVTPGGLFELTRISPRTAYTLVDPRARECPYVDCAEVDVTINEQILAIGMVTGDTREGSNRWYRVIRGDEMFVIHEGSLTFSAPASTPLPSTTTYYIDNQSAFIRSCPDTSCDLVTSLYIGDAIEITDNNIQGENVLSGTRWMQGIINGNIVFVHSDLVSNRPPPPTVIPNTVNTIPNLGSTGSSGSNTSRRPADCPDARAMGLSAVQAAQWDHLDRDNDGVACYGD